MKNVLIIVFAVTSLLFLVYGFVQQAEAERQKILGVAILEELEKTQLEYDKQRLLTEELKVRLKNCEAREGVMHDIVGEAVQ